MILFTLQQFRFAPAAILLNRLPTSLFLMTTRRIDDTLLSAAPPTPTVHPPASATIYTDPPATHQGHFLPNNPMPYMAPSATHQPELLLLTWMLRTITTLVDDLQHHPLVHDPIPAMSTFTTHQLTDFTYNSAMPSAT